MTRKAPPKLFVQSIIMIIIRGNKVTCEYFNIFTGYWIFFI